MPLFGGVDTYLGSTKNIYQRCYIQHKNHAFINTKKHLLFYNKVVQNGWESFQFSILAIIPDYCAEFSKIYPEYEISKKDMLILSDLISLELTIAEQIYLNYYKPNLNSSKLANWSTYNKGFTGYIRSNEMNDTTSLQLLNRNYNEYTKELHRKNNTGKIFDLITREKMSKSQGGVAVKILNGITNEELAIFNTKSSLAKELNVSLRTVSRWLDDDKIHSTLSLKYPKVKIVSCQL